MKCLIKTSWHHGEERGPGVRPAVPRQQQHPVPHHGQRRSGVRPNFIVLSLWFWGNTISLWKDNHCFNLKNCGFSFTKPHPGYIHMYTSVVLYLPLMVSLILQKMKNSISGYYVHNICTILKWFFLVWLRRSNLPEGWGSPRATPSTAWTGTITTTMIQSMR